MDREKPHQLSLSNLPNSPNRENRACNPPQQKTSNELNQQIRPFSELFSKSSKTSIYIENLPSNCTISILSKALQDHDIVGNSYIAQKRTQRGLCFGFVSLVHPEDFSEAIAKIRTIMIGDNKLRAYPANNDKPQKVTSKPTTSHQGIQSSNRSFVDIVRGNCEEVISYSTHGENLEWLKRSARIQLKDAKFLSNLKEKVASDQLISMGDNTFLCVFHTVDQRKTFLEEENIDKSEFICDCQAWVPSMKSNHRVIWLAVQGIPLQAWTKDFFVSVGNKFGRFICLDQITEKKKQFDVARVMISTSAAKINQALNVLVDGCPFEICIKEETEAFGEERNTKSISWQMEKKELQNQSVGEDRNSGNYAEAFGDMEAIDDEGKPKKMVTSGEVVVGFSKMVTSGEEVVGFSKEGHKGRGEEIQNSKFDLPFQTISEASFSSNKGLSDSKEMEIAKIADNKFSLEVCARLKQNHKEKNEILDKEENQSGNLVIRQSRRPKKGVKLKQRKKRAVAVESCNTNEDSSIQNHFSFGKIEEDAVKLRDIDLMKGFKKGFQKIILKKLDG